MVAGRDGDKAVSAERTGGINAMTVADRIRSKLTEAFRPEALEVVDESHLHKGHAGHRPEGETHFRVRITARAFAGKTRVAMHRMIHTALASEIREGVHALAIEAKAVPPPSSGD
jgi:BolA family transcriptional regulator, general stress-responsive regulator